MPLLWLQLRRAKKKTAKIQKTYRTLVCLTTLQYKSKNSTESIFLRRIISKTGRDFGLWSDLFWFWNRSKKGSREIELPKIKPNRNEEEEKKQILFENSTWKFVFSEAIPKRFSSIKVGLCTFIYQNSFKIKFNNLKICLDGLVLIVNSGQPFDNKISRF